MAVRNNTNYDYLLKFLIAIKDFQIYRLQGHVVGQAGAGES